MNQFYIVEVQQYANGEYGHIVHFAYDQDEVKALLKAESKFYEVLSAAAISELPNHSAILFGADGSPIMNRRYTHDIAIEEEPPVEGGNE